MDTPIESLVRALADRDLPDGTRIALPSALSVKDLAALATALDRVVGQARRASDRYVLLIGDPRWIAQRDGLELIATAAPERDRERMDQAYAQGASLVEALIAQIKATQRDPSGSN